MPKGTETNGLFIAPTPEECRDLNRSIERIIVDKEVSFFDDDYPFIEDN